jgi:hypothetical protein
MHFKELCDEVKRRATRDQSGTTFDQGIKNCVNFALYRIARDAPWRSMRRKTTFDTVSSYLTGDTSRGGSGCTVTSGSTTISIPDATLITDQVQIGRKFKTTASGTYYFIKTIPSETSITVDRTVLSASSSGNSFEILPQEEYVLPMQAGHRIFMWHEGFGYPFRMNYITDMDFYQHGVYLTIKYIPTHYRMWGEDMALTQVRQPSVINVVSSSSSDTNIPITVFGTVSGYPDYEIINTNGLTSVAGTKTFSYVERITKGTSSIGRITCTANSGNDTVAVLPVGDTTSGPLYRKIQVYPLPNQVFPIHLQYYKYPYRLVNDGDVHELGEDFDEAIILLATGKIKAEANLGAEADRFMMLWQDEIRSLKRTNVDKIDWFPTLRRPRQASSDALVAPNLLYRQAGANFGPASRL